MPLASWIALLPHCGCNMDVKVDLMLDGLLLVDKPGCEDATPLPPPESPGDATSRRLDRSVWTSHDVVAVVRKWSGQRRIGHTGTLDPMASGLLLLCLGKAARLVEFYQHQTKHYHAEITLGGVTDTDDATGVLLERNALPPLTAATIDRALDAFRGVVQQRPPSFSAIKQEGEALYRRARRGSMVEAPMRTVTFHRIELAAFTPPDRISLEIVCSAGTYIRSLARDVGAALGVGAYLRALRRTRIGAFAIDEAHTLPEIEAASCAGKLPELLLPVGERLSLPNHVLEADQLMRLGYGQHVTLPGDACEPARQLAAARDSTGRLVGVMRRLGADENGGWRWKAEKWL